MGFGASQQHSVDNTTPTDCGIGVLTTLPKFDNDENFGQAVVSGPGIIGFARFKSVRSFRHRETSRPEAFTVCPSHLMNQMLRDSCGVAKAKVDILSESRPWSSALVIKTWTLRWWCGSVWSV